MQYPCQLTSLSCNNIDSKFQITHSISILKAHIEVIYLGITNIIALEFIIALWWLKESLQANNENWFLKFLVHVHLLIYYMNATI